MENTLVFYIESAKKQIAELEIKKQDTKNDFEEGLVAGQLIGRRSELNILENLLAQQQKEALFTQYVYKEELA